jgi:hypothetical protein
MQSVVVTLDTPLSQFVDHRSRERHTSPQQTVMELVSLGFHALLRERYIRYQRGEISFGRLAEDLGITSWELSHLLEEQGWPAYNLPSTTVPSNQPSLHDGPIEYELQKGPDATDESISAA